METEATEPEPCGLRSLGRGERWWASAVVAVVVLLVALPGVRTLVEGRDAADGFPLSTYPMFSRERAREVRIPTVVAVREDGEVERLSPRVIAQTDQVIQAATTVSRAVSSPARARELCADVAGRVSAPATVAVVVEEHDALRWAADSGTDPLDRREVATCPATG